MVKENVAFDFHGYVAWPAYFDRYTAKARERIPQWEASLNRLPVDVLISEKLSKEYDGLWLREPCQFLHDALPRAFNYLRRYGPPPRIDE